MVISHQVLRWKLLIKSELSKMEPNETSLVDSWKIQQFTDIFVTELTSQFNWIKSILVHLTFGINKKLPFIVGLSTDKIT